MVNSKYVKRKKAKKIAIIASSVSACLIVVFVLLTLIGHSLGNFTVSLSNRDGVSIALDLKAAFNNPTTYLRVGDLPSLDETTYDEIMERHGDSQIDNELTDSFIGGQRKPSGDGFAYLKFFKLTYFIKNTGSSDAQYDFTLNVLENRKPNNWNYTLLDLLRVVVYENDGTDITSHDWESFGKEEFDGTTYKAVPISKTHESGPDMIITTPFVSDQILVQRTNQSITAGEIVRYTILFWLEGTDTQSFGDRPDECSLKLGANIQAYAM